MLKNGELFHTFTIRKFCGEGAYGSVYLANDFTGRTLALKIVSKKKIGDLWKRELRGLVNYNKITGAVENLLRIWHIDEDDDTFFYTMEPADNASADPEQYLPDTLDFRLKQGRVPPAELFELAEYLLTGLRTIHDAGMVHRDIKPSNILFVNGRPKLGDIGLMSSEQTMLTHLVGTMDFIPPEVKRNPSKSGKDDTVLKKNDIYAFGMVLYCALTGFAPEKFPSLPEDLPHHSAVKQLNHLLCCACSTDSFRRIRDTDEFLVRLKNARDRTGLSPIWRESFCLSAEQIHFKLRGYGRRIQDISIHHPLILFPLLLLLLSGVALLIFLPEKKIETASEEIEPGTYYTPRSVALKFRSAEEARKKELQKIWTDLAAKQRYHRLFRELRRSFFETTTEIVRNPFCRTPGTDKLQLTLPLAWREYRKNRAVVCAPPGSDSYSARIPEGGRAVFWHESGAWLEICFYKENRIGWTSDSEWKKYVCGRFQRESLRPEQIQLSRQKNRDGAETIFCAAPVSPESLGNGMAFQKFNRSLILYQFRCMPETWSGMQADFKKIINFAKKIETP